MSLDIKGLSLSIGSSRILSNVSLNVKDGERVGLVGSSAVSYTHLTLPTKLEWCRSRWSPYH